MYNTLLFTISLIVLHILFLCLLKKMFVYLVTYKVVVLIFSKDMPNVSHVPPRKTQSLILLSFSYSKSILLNKPYVHSQILRYAQIPVKIIKKYSISFVQKFLLSGITKKLYFIKEFIDTQLTLALEH